MKLNDVIKDHVIKTFEKCGSREKAAKELGIAIRTLRNYLNEWGMGYEARHGRKYTVVRCDQYRSLTPEERDQFENMDYY